MSTRTVLIASLLITAACGGAPFTAGQLQPAVVGDDAAPDADSGNIGDPPDSGAPETSTMDHGGNDGGVNEASGPDGGESGAPESGAEGGVPESGGPDAPTDAPPDAPPPDCVTDLSNVGGGDFHIAFTIVTLENNTTYALLNQRAGCDTASVWWDVSINSAGGVIFTTDDGSAASVVSVEAGDSVNDGVPHHIVVERVAGAISYWDDGVLRSATQSDPYAFGAFSAPLAIGSSQCGNEAPLTGHGVITNLCITTP
jgi:hypothetical protein